MPLGDGYCVHCVSASVVLGTFSWVRCSLVQVDQAPTQKLITFESWLFIPCVEYDGRSLVKSKILVREVKSLVEDWIKSFIDDFSLQLFAFKIPHFDKTVCKAVIVGCWQISRLENENADVRHIHASRHFS